MLFRSILKLQMQSSKPARSPCAPHLRLVPNEGSLLSNPHEYQSLVGSLHYLTFTRPDLSFAVHQVCQFMSFPTDVHLIAAKRILRYITGTLNFGILLQPGPISLSLPSLAQTGQVILLIDDLPLASLPIFCTTLLSGVLRSKTQCPDLLLNLSTMPWLLQLLNYVGFDKCSKIWAFFFPLLPSFGVIMYLPWQLHLILSSTPAPNIWRLITILFVRGFCARIFK